MLQLLLGFTLGLAIAMPPTGPVAILVIQQMIKKQVRRAFAIALGAGLTGSVLLFTGLTGIALLNFNDTVKNILGFSGIILLFILGVRELLRKNVPIPPNQRNIRSIYKGQAYFLLGVSFVVGNPTVYVTYTALTALIKGYEFFTHDLTDNALISAGMLVGNISWYLFLANMLTKNNRTVSHSFINVFGRATGIILIGIAFAMFYKKFE